MRNTLIIVFILCIVNFTFGQKINISLSPQHSEKLNKFKGHKRMLKYYKYYKADSAKSIKVQIKQSKKKWDILRQAEIMNARVTERLQQVKDKENYIDSIQHAYAISRAVLSNPDTTRQAKRHAEVQLRNISKNKVSLELAQHGQFYFSRYQSQDSLKNELTKWWTIVKNPDTPDSLKDPAKQKVKELVLVQINSNPQFKGILEDYKSNGQIPDWETLENQIPGLDTLGGIFNSSPESLLTHAEELTKGMTTRMDGIKSLSDATEKIEDLQNEWGQRTNPDNVKAEGTEAIRQQTIDHFAEHADKLIGPKENVAGLLDKYKSFTNSGDLSSAVKRTSLQGKTLWERIVVGGNFNIVSTKPFSIDLSPLMGYRFNTKLYAGIGMNYRCTFGDSIRHQTYISPSNSSFRFFTNWDIFRNFFSYAEFERSGLSKSGEKPMTTWSNTYFIGLGKKLLVHPKVFMVVTALYRINDETSHSYPSRFQMRIGFQSSDLAFRKKKVYYSR